MRILFLAFFLFSAILISSETPLDIFEYIQTENWDKVIEMIEDGIDVNIKNPKFFNDTPLISISFKYEKPSNRILEVVQMLLNRGARVNEKNIFGTNAVTLSAMLHKDSKMFLMLDNFGANLKDSFYDSEEGLLHIAITNKNKGVIDIFNHLLNIGLNIDHQNKAGITPIMLAMDENCDKHAGCGLKSDLIHALVDGGANLNLEDKYFGFTALKFGIDKTNDSYNESFPDILYLLDHGANVDQEAIDMADDYELKTLLKKYLK